MSKMIIRDAVSGRPNGIRDLTPLEEFAERVWGRIETYLRTQPKDAHVGFTITPPAGASSANMGELLLDFHGRAQSLAASRNVAITLSLQEQRPAPRSARKTVQLEVEEPRPRRIYAHSADGRPSEFDGYVTDYVEPPADFPRLPGWPVPGA